MSKYETNGCLVILLASKVSIGLPQLEKYLVYPGSTCCTHIYSQKTQSSFLKYPEMSNAKKARNTMAQGLIQTAALVHWARSFLPRLYFTLSESKGLLTNTNLPARPWPTVRVFHFTDTGEVQRNLEGLCLMVMRRFQTLLHRHPLWSWQPVQN